VPTALPLLQSYTSARIHTKGLLSVGPTPQFPRVRIEARLRATPGPGLWPAFW